MGEAIEDWRGLQKAGMGLSLSVFLGLGLQGRAEDTSGGALGLERRRGALSSGLCWQDVRYIVCQILFPPRLPRSGIFFCF